MTSLFSNVIWIKFVYDSGSVGISFLEMPGCSSDLGHMIGVIASCKGAASVPTLSQKKHLHSSIRISLQVACCHLPHIRTSSRCFTSEGLSWLIDWHNTRQHDACHLAWLRVSVLEILSPSSSLFMSMGKGSFPTLQKLLKLSSNVS